MTLTTVPQADFPKNPAYNVQMHVRARKSGDDPLAGASTRRLVQFGLTRQSGLPLRSLACGRCTEACTGHRHTSEIRRRMAL